MEQRNPYPPLMRAPLKMRGIFGVTWQLYKRGFWPMFGFTLLLVGLSMLIILLLTFSMLGDFDIADFQSGMLPYGDFSEGSAAVPAAAAMMKVMGITQVISLVYMFLVMPSYLGASFMEMNERMEGRVGSFYQLVRYALPIGFKRFYTTFLSLVLVHIVASMVMGLVLGGILITAVVSSVASGVQAGSGLTLAAVLTVVILMLVCIVYFVFLSLIYPVAAHEGKRAFDAVGRGMKLSIKRFGRLFGALSLYILIVLVSEAVLVLPWAFLMQNATAVVFAYIGLSLWGVIMAPYFSAFCTALYVDSAARIPEFPPAGIVPVPPAQQQA